MFWKELLAIIIGGGIGSGLRFIVSRWVQLASGHHFPFGLLAVNVTGSFLIGLLSIILVQKFHVLAVVRIGVLVGVLGGFTTFSSFSAVSVELFEAGMHVSAILNVFVSIILCLGGTAFGLALGRLWV